MKRVTHILFLLFIASCSNNSSISKNETLIDNSSMIKNYTTKSLVKEKFLELYDLNLLLKKHSSFKNDVIERIKGFSKDSVNLIELKDSSGIKNIRFKGDIIKVSDSVKKIKLIYDFRNQSGIKTDSIYAFIISSKRVINSEEFVSNKVKFSKSN